MNNSNHAVLRDNKMKQKLGGMLRNGGGIVIAFVLLFVIMCFASPYFFAKNNLIALMKSAVTTAFLAYAMTFTLIAGEIDLSISSIFAFGAMMCLYFMSVAVPVGWAILIAFVLCICFGTLNGLLVAYTTIPAFIITLSTQRIIRGVIYLVSGGQPIATKNAVFRELGSGKFVGLTYPIIICIVISIILAILLKNTIWGRKVYACGGNRDAARFSGINTGSIVVSVYVLSAALACIAGILAAARIAQAQPTAGDGYESDAIAAAVLGGTSFTGGRGSIAGTVIGALVLALLQNGMNLLGVSYYWQLLIQGALIIVAVYIDTAGRK